MPRMPDTFRISRSKRKNYNFTGFNKGKRPKSRTYMNRKFRETVFARDNYMCLKCNENFHYDHLEMDHIIPLESGGSDEIDNLQTLCIRCHTNKTREDIRKMK